MSDYQKQNDSGPSSDRKTVSDRKGKYTPLFVCIIIFVILALIIFQRKNIREAEDITLRASLYPVVPDMESYENAVIGRWKAEHPDINLELVDWYCYGEDLPDDLDVFVFDGIFLSEYLEKGYLLPIPEEAVRDKEDFVPFAIDGLRENGEFCAVPQFLCTSLLYTRKDDTELADVSDIVTLYEKIGDRKTQTEIPEDKEGLLIDMSGGTTKVTMYLDAQIDQNDEYTEYADLPVQGTFSEEVLDLLRMLVKMGGEAQVKYEPENGELYVRSKWFSEGKGRAYIGFSEEMSEMGEYVNAIDFRTFSYSEKAGVPLFSVDLAGVNAKISDEKKELAYELVDLITGEETMTEIVNPDGSGSPQYLFPARIHIYDLLGESLPVYGRLKPIVLNPENRFLRMGSNAHEYISNTKKVLPEMVFSEE